MDSYQRILAGEALTFVLSPRSLWRMSGPDSERYLNGQVTNDMTKLRVGQAGYAAVCTAKGRMDGDVSIARHADGFYLDSHLELRESLGARLDKYLIADDAVLEDISETWSLSHVTGAESPAAPEGGFIITYPRYGLPGHDIWVKGTDAALVGSRVEPDVIETLRIEHAAPRWGFELTAHTLPPEAGPVMLEAISYSKGCYVGQETIARLKSVGHVNRSLVLLKSDSEIFPARGAKLMNGDREAGVVTSSVFSRRLQKGAALAFAQRQFTAEGTTFQVQGIPMSIVRPLSFGSK